MVKTFDYIDIQLDILALAFPKYCEQELLCKLSPANKCRNLVCLLVTSFYLRSSSLNMEDVLKTKIYCPV